MTVTFPQNDVAPSLVYEHPMPAVDGEGFAYRARAYAEPDEHGAFRGYLEFTPSTPSAPVLHSEHETVQATTADVERWAVRLGAHYLDDALERAKRRSGVPPLRRPRLVREHGEPLVGNDGLEYRARSYTRCEAYCMWVAWLQFHPTARDGAVLRTRRVISQPDISAVEDWASGLNGPYLQGALVRAR